MRRWMRLVSKLRKTFSERDKICQKLFFFLSHKKQICVEDVVDQAQVFVSKVQH